MIVVAETASGGETIPPKRKPSANVNPGMITYDANATTQEVIITMIKAKLIMILLHFRTLSMIPATRLIKKRWKKNKEEQFRIDRHIINREVKLSSNPPNTSTIGKRYAVYLPA
jgi:hypothetical protein